MSTPTRNKYTQTSHPNFVQLHFSKKKKNKQRQIQAESKVNIKRSRIKSELQQKEADRGRKILAQAFSRTMLTSVLYELNVFDLNCITAPQIYNMPNALYPNITKKITVLALASATAIDITATSPAANIRQ